MMSGRRKLRDLLQRGTAIFLVLLIGGFTVYTQSEPGGIFAEETVVSEEAEVTELGEVEVEGADEKSDEVIEEMEESGGEIVFSSDNAPDKKKTVRLAYNKKIKYEGYFTRNYTVTVDGKKEPAYCLQPSMGAQDRGKHTAVLYDRSLMTKALYYSYGYPGYDEMTKDYLAGAGLKKCYRGSDGNYAFCHILLSYIYEGCVSNCDAFRGVGSASKTKVKNFLAQLRKWPDPVDNSGISLSETSLKARWNRSEAVQETDCIRVNAHKDNYITVKVPEGVTMIKTGDEKTYTGTAEGVNVRVAGGDEFRFTAPGGIKGEYKSPVMQGHLASFHSYMIKVSGRQDMLLGVTGRDSVSFTVKWVDFGQLLLQKKSSDPARTDAGSYYSLEGAGYSIFRIGDDGEREDYGKIVTGSDGRGSVTGLPYGSYVIVEKDAPRGFVLDEKEHSVVIDRESVDITLEEQPEVPELATAAEWIETDGEIRDKVTCRGLAAGEKYRVKGVLMDRSTGESTGTEGSRDFEAGEADGEITVTFSVDGKAMAGKSLVAFEYLYHVGAESGEETLLASHEDIDDESQRVTISMLPADNAPQTGDENMMLTVVMMILIGVSIAGITAILTMGRRKKNEKKS